MLKFIMRRFILYLFLVVIYDQALIENDSILYEINVEYIELDIEIVCSEDELNCSKPPEKEPTYEEIVEYINEIVY